MDPLVSAEHALGTTALDCILLNRCSPRSQQIIYTHANTISIHVVQSGITHHKLLASFFLCAYYSQHQLNTQKTEFKELNLQGVIKKFRD